MFSLRTKTKNLSENMYTKERFRNANSKWFRNSLRKLLRHTEVKFGVTTVTGACTWDQVLACTCCHHFPIPLSDYMPSLKYWAQIMNLSCLSYKLEPHLTVTEQCYSLILSINWGIFQWKLVSHIWRPHCVKGTRKFSLS